MRFLKWSVGLVLAFALAAFIAFRVKDPERRSINDEARKAAPGRFVRLSQGVTHYEIAGPDSGSVVVLAAAFSVPAYLSDSLYQGLADSGFRVIRFDYYGRGWSDRPDARYDLDTFVRQLDELLDSLRIGKPVNLGGLSFGAAIVTDFTPFTSWISPAIVNVESVVSPFRSPLAMHENLSPVAPVLPVAV